MNRSSLKKYGRRKGGTYGRTHGPTKGGSKRRANKAVRRHDPESICLCDQCLL